MPVMEERFAPPPVFEAAMDQVHELVVADVGANDFGPGDYVPGLKVLLQSMDYDPRFTPLGRRVAWGQVINALSARARAFKSMRENPAFARTEIKRPLVITGIPRTGTTALHKLLALDPQFQGLQTWLVSTPMPRPPRDAWEAHPMFQQATAQLARRYETAPQSRAAHLMAAEEVDECCLVLRQGFVSNLWTVGWSAATYDAWWQCQSEAAAYAYYRDCLRLIGMEEPNKRWLLKNPGHIATLADLFATFPDALVVQTHRDPAKAVPSLCGLLMHRHELMEDGRRDQRARIMLAREVAKWSKAVRDAEAVRAAHAAQVLDVVHGDLHAQPMAVIKRIYAFAGLNLSPNVEAEMRVRIDEKPELQHGVHRYDVAEFGMREDEIRARFGDYIDRFDLNLKRSPA